jgi:SET domain-containing protein
MFDGAQGGNSARWINHRCAPNCEARQQGDRIFIHATRKFEEGAEILIDYQLDVEGRRTAALRRMYACRCGARRCRGTMLESRR